MTGVTDALYSRDILRLAASIPFLHRLDRPMSTVEKSSPVCGSRVAVDIVTDQDGRVIELGQEVRACALGQASASLLAAHVVGRTAGEIDEARKALADYLAGGRDDPGDWPGLDVFVQARRFPARHGSILLAFEAAAEAASLAIAQPARP